MTVPIFVLHCEELAERTEACRKHLRDRGVAATWWQAPHGRSWGLATTSEYEPGKRLPPGHVSLDLAFWNLLQHVKLSCPPSLTPVTVKDGRHAGAPPGDDCFVVFEDDVEVPGNFHGVLNDLLVELEHKIPDWQLVFMGTAEVAVHVWQKITDRVGGGDSRLCRMTDPFGTHALLLRRSAIPILMKHMRRAERNLDQQLWKYVLQPGRLKWCAVLPSIVTQRTFDYEGTGKPQWAPSCVHEDDDKVVPAAVPQAPAPEPKANPRGPQPSLEVVEKTSAAIDPLPCWYRGEYLDRVGRGVSGRTVPLAECGLLGVPCHDRPFAVREGGEPVTACASCGHRTRKSPVGPRPRLRLPEGHFNCGMAEWNGRLVLATRDSWGHSRVALWGMTNTRTDWTGEWTATPISSVASDHPQAPRLEDPRLFVAPHPDTGEPRLHAAMSMPDGYPPKLVQVGYVRFSEDLRRIEHTEVFRSPYGNAYEKNWSPFVGADGLSWVYATKPDHVVIVPTRDGKYTTYKTSNPFRWTGGALRGGAPPVLVGEEYWHVVHGCVKQLRGNIYSVGVVAFEPFPPYRVTRQTAKPVIWPDPPAPDESIVKRFVVWPGGAVVRGGRMFLSLGIDDTFCRIQSLSLSEIEEAMSDERERDTDRPVSIRETPISTGQKYRDVEEAL